MRGIMTAKNNTTLENRLRATMFLAETGWRCRTQWQREGDVIWEVFFAVHDHYPEQRALTIPELVKRCVWAETHRTPTRTTNGQGAP